MYEPSAAESAFFEHTFSETLVVLEQARDSIVSGVARGHGMDLTPVEKMRLSQELSRLTSRAAGAMSLLLMYKAIISDQGEQIDNIPQRLEELYASVIEPAPLDGQEIGLPAEVDALCQRAEAIFGCMGQLYALIAARIAN